MISTTFFFSIVTFLSISCIYCSRSTLSIQLLFWFPYMQGKCLTTLKQEGDLDLPMINIGKMSPIAFAATILVRRILLCLPPKQASFRRLSDFLGHIWKTTQIHLNYKFHQACAWTKFLSRTRVALSRYCIKIKIVPVYPFYFKFSLCRDSGHCKVQTQQPSIKPSTFNAHQDELQLNTIFQS